MSGFNQGGGYNNRQNYSSKSQRSSGQGSYQNEPVFTAEFIGKGFRKEDGKLRTDLLGDEASKIAEQISNQISNQISIKLSTSQLRAFYGEVKALESRLSDDGENFDDVFPFVLMLKSKAEYKYRNGKGKNFPKSFRDFIVKSVDEIKRVGNQQAFEDFCLLFEAVVGFVYGINGGK